jgi:hypothetical protein
MPYVPPKMREKGVVPKKLATPKFVEERKAMTKQELFESIRLKEYGKADGAWFGDGGP